jgi:catalase
MRSSVQTEMLAPESGGLYLARRPVEMFGGAQAFPTGDPSEGFDLSRRRCFQKRVDSYADHLILRFGPWIPQERACPSTTVCESLRIGRPCLAGC